MVVGMGTCGIAAGARDTLAAVMDEVNTRNLRHIAVTQTRLHWAVRIRANYVSNQAWGAQGDLRACYPRRRLAR